MSTEQPAFKQAKDVEAGDWLAFGPLLYHAGQPVVLESGRIWIPLGHSGAEYDPDHRIRIHHDAEETHAH